MQRVRIGLTGLAFVFVLVLLGAVVSRSSRDAGAVPNVANSAENNQPSDPLSDLGVAPKASAEPENVSGTSPKSK